MRINKRYINFEIVLYPRKVNIPISWAESFIKIFCKYKYKKSNTVIKDNPYYEPNNGNSDCNLEYILNTYYYICG